MPTPVSLTDISTPPFVGVARTSIRPPSGVNLIALDSRFSSTCLFGLVAAGGFQLPALVLDLVKQPGILDGQRGLRGEGPKELNGLARELAGHLPHHGEATDQVVVAQERNGEQGPVAGPNERAPSVVAGWQGV